MTTQLVFETHSWSEDNEVDRASGWHHSRLSPRGRDLAHELRERRLHDEIAVVLVSDLWRAVETADIVAQGTSLPVLHDWRLRECNYGDFNGHTAAAIHHDRLRYLDEPYPNGESWRQAVARVGRALDDVKVGWPEQRVMVIGHVATRWALDHFINGRPLEALISEEFAWREGWEYLLP